ncbi:MAG: hypothetical protein V9F82_13330 [Dermatophilaceae bacterium]
MYGALWRALPGGRPAKILQSVVLVGIVVAVLFVWVFPALAPLLPFEDVTLAPSPSPTTT